MRKNYQGKAVKSKGKFEVLGRKEVLVQVPLPLVEVWEDLQPRVEQRLQRRLPAPFRDSEPETGHGRILRASLKNSGMPSDALG